MLRYRLRQALLLGRVRGVDALLHDTAAVHVAGNLSTVLDHGIVDELFVPGLPRVQDLLYHVIAIDLARERDKLASQVLR